MKGGLCGGGLCERVVSVKVKVTDLVAVAECCATLPVETLEN